MNSGILSLYILPIFGVANVNVKHVATFNGQARVAASVGLARTVYGAGCLIGGSKHVSNRYYSCGTGSA